MLVAPIEWPLWRKILNGGFWPIVLKNSHLF